MKKAYLILFAFILSNIAIAQTHSNFPANGELFFNNPYKLYADSIKNENRIRKESLKGTKALTLRWDTIVYHRWDDSLGFRSSRNFYPNGLVQTILNEHYYNSNWGQYTKDSFNYSSSGVLLSNYCDLWYYYPSPTHSITNYTYNTNGDLLSELRDKFVNGIFVSTDSMLYTYDVAGNLTSMRIYQYYDSTYSYDLLYEYTYTASNQLKTGSVKVFSNGTIVFHQKAINDYDLNGNKIKYNFFDFKNNTWNPYESFTKTFDNNNNMLTQIDSNSYNGFYQIYRTENYSYTNFNKPSQCISEYYNNSSPSGKYKIEYTYNGSQDLLNRKNFNWINNSWQVANMHSFTYDNNNLLLTDSFAIWTNNAWELGSIHSNNYNSTGKLLVHRDEFYYLGSLNSIRTDSISYNINDEYLTVKFNEYLNGVWGFNKDTAYFLNEVNFEPEFHRYYAHYSMLPSGISNTANSTSNIKIFPNPTSETINIEVNLQAEKNYISVYNLNGQKLLQEQFTGTKTTLDLTNLKSGIYFIEIRNDQMVEVKKMVKD